MIKITPEIIAEVNKLCPNNWEENSQGIWKEADGVPNTEKGFCLVMGGSCWGDEATDYFNPTPNFEVLDHLLKILEINPSKSKYDEILKYKMESDSSDLEYYGNYTDWETHYIPLKDVLKVIGLKYLLEEL
jgi:hypothetical protein